MDKRKIIATFERDTKRFHRFLIGEGQGITGSLYLPKDERIPEVLEIELQVKVTAREARG